MFDFGLFAFRVKDEVVRLMWYHPFSTHVAFCDECKEEVEFPLDSSECPLQSLLREKHDCFDHSAESFAYYEALKARETGFGGFWRKLTGTVELENESALKANN